MRKVKADLTMDLDLPNSQRIIFCKYLEKTAFYGTIITIFLTAIPYGTVDSWFKLLFVFLICIFAVCRVIEGILSRRFLISEPLFFAPLLGILLLAIAQIVPFNNLFDLSGDSALSGKTLSLNAFETRNFILVFIGLLLATEILFRYTTTEKRLRVLIYLVLSIGIGSAVFGLLRVVFTETQSSNLSFPFSPKVQFAQFVNRNHFAFLMEMTLGLLVGLFLKANLSQFLKLLSAAAIGLIGLVLILANSRGGIISAVSLCLFAVFTHFLTKNQRTDYRIKGKFQSLTLMKRVKPVLTALLFSCLFLGVAVFTVSFIGGDAVASRMETIRSEVRAEERGKKVRRREIWQSTLSLIKANPVVGVGFGAYGVGITEYDNSTGQFQLQQAHNDYLEIMANGGIIGFVLAIIFLLVLLKGIREQFASSITFRWASCFGATAGIIGVLLHSTVDFGLHVVVNALVFIVLVVIATAKIPYKSNI